MTYKMLNWKNTTKGGTYLIYVVAVIAFLILGALTRGAPVLGLFLILGGFVLAFFLGVTTEQIETFSPVIGGAVLGFLLGLISRFID